MLSMSEPVSEFPSVVKYSCLIKMILLDMRIANTSFVEGLNGCAHHTTSPHLLSLSL